MFFTVIGDNMNRRVSIYKIGNRSTTTLADYRRADIFLPNEILNLLIRISKSKSIDFVCVLFCLFVNSFMEWHAIFWINLGGNIEIFSKHDHTQYKLLAAVEDHSYKSAVSLNYVSFASFNNTPMQFYYDCKMVPSYIDTQVAKKYAGAGHPLLLDDPPFQTPIDKRNCKSNAIYFVSHETILIQ